MIVCHAPFRLVLLFSTAHVGTQVGHTCTFLMPLIIRPATFHAEADPITQSASMYSTCQRLSSGRYALPTHHAHESCKTSTFSCQLLGVVEEVN